MSIASEISRLQGAKADIKTAIEAKGVTVPSAALIDDYANYVDAIQQGSATVATTTKAVGGSNVSSLAFTVSGKPKMFAVQLSLASSGSYLTNSSTSTYLVSSVIGDGSNVYTTACRYNSSGTRAAREYYYTTGSTSYSNGTFTVTAGTGSFAANQTYRLIYVY